MNFMEIAERVFAVCLFGLPAVMLIGANYARIFSKKIKGSPAYFIGGILGAFAVLAALGEDWAGRWYLCLIPIGLDWGLGIVSLLYSIFGPRRNPNPPDGETKEAQEECGKAQEE